MPGYPPTPGPSAPVAPTATVAPTASIATAPPAAHGSPIAPPAPPSAPQRPTHQPVPGLAPDTHGADVGLAPDPVGTLPAVEVRIAESSPTDYARISTEAEVRTDDFSLAAALMTMLEMRGSDLHLTAGAPPTVRVDGSLRPIPDTEELTPDVIQRVMYSVCTQQQRERFEETLELDFSYALPEVARFRVNLYKQRDSLGAAFRVIPFEIKSLESLGMPPALGNLAALPRGFVLVTGPTGSGKSTTLAAMVDLANRTRNEHIMTVEDPIEFLHQHKGCLVNQREVGEDTYSFANALKHVLRQDPDIILVGEMRDLETIQVALTAAETGHLVFATLHTQDAAQTIDRVIDVFPPAQQQQIRQQLAGTLQGIVCQTLCKTADGRGRVAATEVLMATPAIRNLIREGKTHQIYSALQAGAQHGMHTLDQNLAELVKAGRITYDTGFEKCHHVEDYTRLAGRA
jgi:twitching motility protein PilT